MWSNIFVRKDPKVPKREIKMAEIEENWQPAKFYCSEIKLIYSIVIMVIFFLILCQRLVAEDRTALSILLILKAYIG